MNPLLYFKIASAWSYRRELFYVSLAFLIALLVPVIAIILLTQAGIDVVSDHLATVNIKTNKIEIHDPATGKVIQSLNANATWPVRGATTLEFGEIDLPYQPLHTGIDIANPNGKIGDPITAFMRGKVIYASEISWGYGKHIIIDHGNNITSVYAHLDKIFVVKGQEITSTDQVIGHEGKTGWATGPHLHFEVRVFGLPVNPRTFLVGNP